MTITPEERGDIRTYPTAERCLSLLDALEAAERERDERFLEIDEAIGSHDGITTLQAVKLLVAEREAISKAHREVIDERDALQGIVDDIASETGHCLLLDDEEHEAPPLPDWVRGIVKERDAAIAELAACKAKLAALVETSTPFACDQGCDAVHHAIKDRHDNRESCPVVDRLRAALAAAKEPTP